MIALRGDLVFDWAGYTRSDTFLAEYIEAMRLLVPGWDADLLPLAADPVGWEFCRATNSRHPSQFPHDPLPRAVAFVRRFRPRPISRATKALQTDVIVVYARVHAAERQVANLRP